MIEQHITSLELSKELFEIGIEQKSLFYWIEINSLFPEILAEKKIIDKKLTDSKYELVYCNEVGAHINIAALTASELMDIIPTGIDIKTNEPFNNFRIRVEKFIVFSDEKYQKAYSVKYVCDTYEATILLDRIYYSEWDTNFANALAKMIIFLKKNNLWNG